MKVESQNRFLRIWWAEEIDELEVGYSLVSFEYDPGIKWPESVNPGVEYTYEYNGYVWNQDGQAIGNSYWYPPRNLFENFPIEDPNKRIVTIYLSKPLHELIHQVPYQVDLTGKDVNNYFKKITKATYNKLKGFLSNIDKNPTVVVYPGAYDGKIYFTYLNWNKINFNDNKISETFDWNTAVVGFSTTGSSTKLVYSKPRSYEKFQSICYGLGRKGSKWRGSKVVLIQDN